MTKAREAFKDVLAGIDSSSKEIEFEARDIGTKIQMGTKPERLWGAWDPIIVLNTNSQNHWRDLKPESFDNVLFHEFAHVERPDRKLHGPEPGENAFMLQKIFEQGKVFSGDWLGMKTFCEQYPHGDLSKTGFFYESPAH